MIILPAIDLYEKRAVRLYKGEYSKMTVYSEDPPKLAAEFREAGAEWLHVVDLEGAKCGGTPNFDVASKIVRTSGLAVELGGGIRDEETVLRYLDAGVRRAQYEEAYLGIGVKLAEDLLGNLVILFPTTWALDYFLEKNPGARLHSVSPQARPLPAPE